MSRAAHAIGPKVMPPLAATTYLVRNAGKTVPLTGVIVLAVVLVAIIVALIDSIPFSIRTIYKYSQECVVVGPRGDPGLTAKVLDEFLKDSPIPIERMMLVRGIGTQIHTIVGKWPFTVVGMSQDDLRYFTARQHTTRLDGRYPKPEEAAAIISQPIARNLGAKIGDTILNPTNTDSYSPFPVKVVGIAQTDRWFMLTDIEYVRANHFPPIDGALVFAPNLREQSRLDEWSIEHFKGSRAQVYAYRLLEKDTDEMFSVLYRILDVVIATLVLVITVLMGMLMNIYQSQRLIEFGLLQAIGYTRAGLVRRVLRESLWVIAVGWLVGVLVSFSFLILAKTTFMDRRGFELSVLDPMAYLYTVPIPLAIIAVATLTVVFRFRKFDPVGVVERRLV